MSEPNLYSVESHSRYPRRDQLYLKVKNKKQTLKGLSLL